MALNGPLRQEPRGRREGATTMIGVTSKVRVGLAAMVAAAGEEAIAVR
jgi:hypothetical protein